MRFEEWLNITEQEYKESFPKMQTIGNYRLSIVPICRYGLGLNLLQFDSKDDRVKYLSYYLDIFGFNPRICYEDSTLFQLLVNENLEDLSKDYDGNLLITGLIPTYLIKDEVWELAAGKLTELFENEKSRLTGTVKLDDSKPKLKIDWRQDKTLLIYLVNELVRKSFIAKPKYINNLIKENFTHNGESIKNIAQSKYNMSETNKGKPQDSESIDELISDLENKIKK